MIKLKHLCAVLLAVYATTAGAADVRKIAADALDEQRDKTHKEKMNIVWPEKTPDMPDNAEAYLITGYINYRCVRMLWSAGKLRVTSNETKRTWFYNPKGESFISEEFDVDAAAFQDTWKAAHLIAQAKTERIEPEKDEGFGSASFGSSSHASSYWVRMSISERPVFNDVVRGWSSSNGIQNFEQLQNRAIHKLFDSLVEKKKGKPVPLTDWADFMKQQVALGIPAPEDKEIPKTNRMLLETALRVLGQTGHVPALEVVEKLEWRLADMGNDYYVTSLREDAEQALVKIRFTNAWNPVDAHKLVVDNARERHSQNDLSKWLRGEYFKRDADGYHARLLADIREYPEDLSLMLETMGELRDKYLKVSSGVFEALLKHQDPEIAADAAFTLLKNEKEHAHAIETLGVVATDVSKPIAPGVHWFVQTGRTRAVDYFLYQAPNDMRWTHERVLAQIFTEGEDGRIVYRLIEHLKRSNFKDNGIYVRAWQKVLAGKVNRGVLIACEQLMELEAADSIPQIEKVLAELESGRNADLNWKRDDKAKYPWTDKYELEGVQKKLDELKSRHKPAP